MKQSNASSGSARKDGVPGAALMNALWTKARIKGDSQQDLARALDISYPYLIALASGLKPVPQLSHDKLRNAAQYIGVPVIQAFLMANVLQPADFVMSLSMDDRLQRVLEAMRADPMWCGFAPTAAVWNQMPKDAQIALCGMYEHAAQTHWLSAPDHELSAPPPSKSARRGRAVAA